MTTWSKGRLDLFVLGSDSSVWHKWRDGTSWGPSQKDWENLGGQAIFEPISVAWGPNRLDLFIIDYKHRLQHKWWDGSKWSGWEDFGGEWPERPSVVSWGKNRLDVFLVGRDRQLYQKWWNGSSWNNGFGKLGGHLETSVSVCSWAENRIDIFGLGGDHSIYHKWWNGSSWGPSGSEGAWENMGGTTYGQPESVCWGPNRIDLFGIGGDSALYTRNWDGSKWSSWKSLGGVCRRIPEVVSWGSGRLDAFVIGTDNGVYHKWFDGGKWQPGEADASYEKMEGIVTQDITVVSQEEGQLDVLVIGTQSNCHVKTYNRGGGGWQPGLTAYDNLGGTCLSAIGSSS